MCVKLYDCEWRLSVNVLRVYVLRGVCTKVVICVNSILYKV